MHNNVHYMNTSARSPVSLLPIFRSQAQYRLMGELYTNPGVDYTVGELAPRIDASHATVSREVARLAAAGLVRTRAQGRRRLVTAARQTPVFAPLRDLMSKVYGVPAVVGEEFDHPLAQRVLIFGSWAARWAGDPGPTPNDVDVLVIGDLDPTDAWEAAARATRRLGIEVNVVVRTPAEWAQDDSGFAEQLRAGPSIDLSGGEAASSSPRPPRQAEAQDAE
jgi:DNA-binding transcriptional ArsR family regulator